MYSYLLETELRKNGIWFEEYESFCERLELIGKHNFKSYDFIADESEDGYIYLNLCHKTKRDARNNPCVIFYFKEDRFLMSEEIVAKIQEGIEYFKNSDEIIDD